MNKTKEVKKIKMAGIPARAIIDVPDTSKNKQTNYVNFYCLNHMKSFKRSKRK